MVFYFTCSDDRYTIYMGRDKYENEDLIKYGWPEDLWFHVDKMSSAHVYLRLPPGDGIDEIPKEIVEECSQLTKANSIEGCKQNNVSIVYTMWSNLRKSGDMDVGQVGFHKPKEVRRTLIEKKCNETINRLNKTKQEMHNDPTELAALREARDKKEREGRRHEQQQRRVEEKSERQRKLAEKEQREYKGVFDEEKMSSNTEALEKLALEGKSEMEACRELEDDFM